MPATIYCVGVGPGDPELMTLKAVRLIRAADVIAVPGDAPQKSAAYQIAAAAVPELEQKALLAVPMPMTRDHEQMASAHRAAASLLEQCAHEGKTVVYLTLGDPTVYCTFAYLRRLLEADGYVTELVAGVPSFCAAAARLGISLAEWDEPLQILPAAHLAPEAVDRPGTLVLMKSGSKLAETKALLRARGRDACAVENCGMPSERVYRALDEIPDDAGYFTLLISPQS